jgi:gas vesicle protein
LKFNTKQFADSIYNKTELQVKKVIKSIADDKISDNMKQVKELIKTGLSSLKNEMQEMVEY